MNLEERIVQIQEQKVLYILSLLSIAMGIDFFSGLIAARMNNAILSKRGINGIIRKIASMILLVFFLPIAIIIPGKSGLVLLSILYCGYLLMEIQSILENYHKMGIPTALFRDFVEGLRQFFNKK